MTLLPRKGLLAIAAVTDVALHGRDRPVSAKALADRHSLPARHLEPVLQALVRDGILRGVRGPRGGYALGRERRRISADDILRAAGNSDDSDSLPSGSALLDNVVMPAVAQAERAFAATLRTLSLEDLMRRAEPFRDRSAG